MACGTTFYTAPLSLLAYKIFTISSPTYVLDEGWLYKSFLVGAAYSLGELPNSFLKRRLNIPEGGKTRGKFTKPFFAVLDNLDSVLTVTLAVYFLYNITFATTISMIVLGSAVHFSTDVYMTHIRLKEPG